MPRIAEFRGVVPGTEYLPANFHLPRHRHFHAYATLVLAGSFEEAGYAGRVQASAGDLLIHPVLDCHMNRMISPGIRLLRLPWPDTEVAGGLHHLDDMDLIVRTAEKDVREAQQLIQDLLRDHDTSIRSMNDWPDLLAHEIECDQTVRISRWAETNGLARETVSRSFSALYGISPVSFRSEWRARAAWLKIMRKSDSLSMIAAHTGFSDQPHMTRWISRIAGAPPSFWR